MSTNRNKIGWSLIKRLTLLVGLLLHSCVFFAQQKFDGYFKMRGRSMYLDIPRNSNLRDIDSFAKQFSLTDIGLYQLVKTGQFDSLQKSGWAVDLRAPARYKLSKTLEALNNRGNPEGRIIFTAVPTPDTWRIVGGNKVIYGVNQFKGNPSVIQENDVLTFYLFGYSNAKSVKLAGSFTNWQFGAFPMAKTDSGWMVKVKLTPGAHYYKFIIDEGKWITDPSNRLIEDDGRGNLNSLVYMINKVFLFDNNQEAKKVNLAGSFNRWNKENISMKKVGNGWVVNMYLEPGTHEYEFWVDGKRYEKTNDSSAAYKSTSIGENYVFKLKGYLDASKVVVAGNFNDWNERRLVMTKTAEGWELSYSLGSGNFQYKFIVDGQWILDPANPISVDDGRGHKNSFMVVGANYEFKLKGFEAARKVYLTGDFSDWCIDCLPMKWNGSEWVCSLYLAKGKHLYKYIVDGKWILDPSNKNWEGSQYRNGNSVLWKD